MNSEEGLAGILVIRRQKPGGGGGGGGSVPAGCSVSWVEESPLKKMAGGEDKSGDFYALLGLKKECSTSELRDAYKRLALVKNSSPPPCFLLFSCQIFSFPF